MQEIIDQTFRDARTNFIYTPDLEQFAVREDWRIHADEVEAGEVWRDDCDGFACTCAELLVRRGVPAEQVRLILCKVETGGGHLVCGVDLDEDTLILDNRQRRVWPNSSIGYTWVSTMKASEPGTWREVEE